MKAIDLSGQTFGRWTVVSRADNGPQNQTRWVCRCKCGNERKVNCIVLRKGLSRSCGCLKIELTRERSTKHGHSPASGFSPTYSTWTAMVKRCTNPNAEHYDRYGGRGIKVCERWLTFENFLADMGEKPEGLTLDREKVDRDYEPGNCRWATMKEQGRNKSNNRVIEFNGESKTLIEWAESLGISQGSLRERLEKWPLQEALTKPASNVRRLTFNGETRSVDEWAQAIGISPGAIHQRIHRGWPIEKILANKRG